MAEPAAVVRPEMKEVQLDRCRPSEPRSERPGRRASRPWHAPRGRTENGTNDAGMPVAFAAGQQQRRRKFLEECLLEPIRKAVADPDPLCPASPPARRHGARSGKKADRDNPRSHAAIVADALLRGEILRQRRNRLDPLAAEDALVGGRLLELLPLPLEAGECLARAASGLSAAFRSLAERPSSATTLRASQSTPVLPRFAIRIRSASRRTSLRTERSPWSRGPATLSATISSAADTPPLALAHVARCSAGAAPAGSDDRGWTQIGVRQRFRGRLLGRGAPRFFLPREVAKRLRGGRRRRQRQLRWRR